MSLNRNPESLTEIERAQGLDPDSKSVLADKGLLLFNAGRRQEAITLLMQMEKKTPPSFPRTANLKYVYLETADYSRYLMEARQEAVLMRDSSTLVIEHSAEKGFATAGGRGCSRPSACNRRISMIEASFRRTYSQRHTHS